jgi:hypothetical protein
MDDVELDGARTFEAHRPALTALAYLPCPTMPDRGQVTLGPVRTPQVPVDERPVSVFSTSRS